MHHDIVIIGTGAGGGTLARRLAETGKRILLVERGEFLPRERENWDPVAVFKEGRYQAKETWFDKSDQPFSPYTHYWVGGNTKVYGAALVRMREHDFGEVRHYGGLSPAWPVGYDVFEPYYAAAERIYSVHGQRGTDPCEPRSSVPYPHGPIAHEPRIAELHSDLSSLGLKPFPAPIGVRLPQNGSARQPYKLSNFDGFPDLTQVKADAQVCAIDPALASPNVSIITGARALRLETDSTGRRVTSLVVEKDGELQTIRADLFVAACGAINSAALLLRSRSDTHPRGLANSSDQVGRNYMTHNNGLFIAVGERFNDAQFQKTFAISDYYRKSEDSDLPLGLIQLMGKLDHDSLAGLAKTAFPGRPAADIAAHSVDFFLTAEDLPDPNNRITLRPDGSIRVSYTENNLEAFRRLEAKLKQVLDIADTKRGRKTRSTYLTAKLGVSGVSHQNGTLRFGTDPKTSVLDTNCKAHDLDNLYAVDGSFFPSSSAVNPSLTIMANALRVGDIIAARVK